MCTVPGVRHGESYPLGGSAITGGIGVTVQCSDGYSPAFGQKNQFTCNDFAKMDMPIDFCQGKTRIWINRSHIFSFNDKMKRDAQNRLNSSNLISVEPSSEFTQ